VLYVLAGAVAFYLIDHADDFGTPRQQLTWAVLTVLVVAVSGYRGVCKRLDDILHELREIRTLRKRRNCCVAAK
jgi:hypothetical protein